MARPRRPRVLTPGTVLEIRSQLLEVIRTEYPAVLYSGSKNGWNDRLSKTWLEEALRSPGLRYSYNNQQFSFSTSYDGGAPLAHPWKAYIAKAQEEFDQLKTDFEKLHGSRPVPQDLNLKLRVVAMYFFATPEMGAPAVCKALSVHTETPARWIKGACDFLELPMKSRGRSKKTHNRQN